MRTKGKGKKRFAIVLAIIMALQCMVFSTSVFASEGDIPPMEANQKMLTGVRLGDGKAGNGDGKYYCLAYTDTFKAIDSRYIPFETKLNSSQYEAADYDFTDQLLTYKGETYAYRPNGPVAGDGKDFHYYTIKFMKVDKLAKSTYGGGYLVEGGHPSSWKLVTDLKKDANTGLYKAGYYHRDYQATLHVGDALDAYDVVEEPIVEEPVIEEPVVEEPVIEEPVIEQPVEEPIVEEPIIEEIVAVPAEGPADPEAAVEPAADEQEAAPAAKAAETEKAAVAKTVETQNAVSARNEMTAKGAATRGTVSLSETVAPQAAPAQMTVIDDDAAPQAGFESQWALMNLVSAVLTILVGMTAMIKSLRNRKGAASIANLLPALVAIVIFALTENVTGAMALTDQWTIPMLAVLAIGGVFSIMGIGRENEE